MVRRGVCLFFLIGLVFASRATPVLWEVIVTFAPVTTDPVLSETVPDKLPVA